MKGRTKRTLNLETTIHPVIMAVPESDLGLKGREKVAALGRRARQALTQSARFSGVRLGSLEKDGHGAPLPSNGTHWSLTHKERYVAAVTAPHSVGIDIEKIRPVRAGMHQRLAGDGEWALAPEADQALFFRYWTAKEAVLKAVGKGLTGLSRCRVTAIPDADHLILAYEDSQWTVAHFWGTKEHIVTVTANRTAIQWHIMEDSKP
jgi:4'-phosphopantetheinyl transferase